MKPRKKREKPELPPHPLLGETPVWVPFPRVVMTSPFFTLRSLPEGRSISVQEGDLKVVYQVGIGQETGLNRGSFSVDEAAVLMALHTCPGENGVFRFGSLSRLGRLIWGKNFSVWFMESLVRSLGALKSISIVRRVEGEKEAPIFTAIADWDIVQVSPTGEWAAWDLREPSEGSFSASWVKFSEAYMKWMEYTLDVNANVFLKLRSRMAQALYLFLPSRAFPREKIDESRPQVLTLREVLEEVGEKVPETVSERLRLFQRKGRTSKAKGFDVIAELDRAVLISGTFRIGLRPCADFTDHEVYFWIEGVGVRGQQGELPFKRNSNLPVRGGKIKNLWLVEGGSADRWNELMSQQLSEKDLSGELNELHRRGVFSTTDLRNNRDSVRMGLRLLGGPAMHDIRERVAKRIIESYADPQLRVSSPPRLWMTIFKDAVAARAKLPKLVS